MRSFTVLGTDIPPPQAPLRWDHTPESVLSITKEAIATSRTLQDQIAAVPSEKCTLSTAFLPVALSEAQLDTTVGPLSFYQNVSPGKASRDASTDAEKLDKGEKLSPEKQRPVDKMILDGKRAGLSLPEDRREELMKLKKEMSIACTVFGRNFNQEKETIAFTREELKGVPEDVVDGNAVVEGTDKVAVMSKTPDIFPLASIFKYAQDPKTCERARVAYENRLEVGYCVPFLLVSLVKLLGYKTWADYVEEEKMIKTSKAVVDFLADLEEKLRPIGIKDRDTLLKLKEKEHAKAGLPFDGQFYIWDYRHDYRLFFVSYYDRLFIEESVSLDDALVKEYFPVDVVVPTILEIYHDLLGVNLRKSKAACGTLFAVWNANAKDESDFLGWAYLDLFPRESKYSHAAVWPLLPAAMVANLAKPTLGCPALMRHDDVVTFFHEMGHVFHGLLSKTRFARFHDTSAARDFVEAPSQMLENWCWEPEVLKKMSSYFEKKEPLSDELIKKLIGSRYVNVGLFYLREIFFGKFDIKVHTQTEPANIDYSKLWGELREETSGAGATHGQGTFAHITGGYDTGYYSYAYSLVFAADMYKTVFKGAPLDPAKGEWSFKKHATHVYLTMGVGKLYREKILQPGASRDEFDSLKDFLGREPNSDAFLENILGSSKKA
ncbi:metallopeptidase MepB [Ceratobasidium sp. AG-Ba]|nr:metallopeptidase MepB [Ceratobasidium sp. AG-Ba]